MNGQYNIGDVVLHNWTLTHLLGQGFIGKVFEAKRKGFTGEYSAAIKIIVIPQTREEVRDAIAEGMTESSASEYFRSVVKDMFREFELMSKLKGDSYIVSYEDHEIIPHTDGIGWDIIIRMELLTPFSSILGKEKLTEEEIINLGIDLCHALELCREYNIIHRNINPDNIFRSETAHYKLGDFKLACTTDGTIDGITPVSKYSFSIYSDEHSFSIRYNYMAPEVYRGEPYGASVDIYSLGIVLYQLLNNNRTPFLPPYPIQIRMNDREAALARRMGGEKIPFPENKRGRLAKIVLKACAYAPKDRYSSPTDMRKALEKLLK